VKTFAIFAMVAILTTTGLGCRSDRFQPWRGSPPPTTQTPMFGGPAATGPIYGQPGMATVTSPAPSSGCGPGCTSCGPKPLQMFAGPQTALPGPVMEPALGQ